ncbi:MULTISPECIES: hydantoinase/oxoprolinase family protein [unclassified Sporolactobacillus]|uniref:hydantoinase/oxoprolinase family protein n=1 Tax=unclassified Sporolactobacillus TaxID=2628533 RepID=UPI002367CB4C|nr:hydantoinase/oxoprolinase family protein [Sporolactobacillus sp. CQH2019]MDD9149013.1 hydantoinase/oxoprolinase family protein [Sporolactobacillus sp. CQH2019]
MKLIGVDIGGTFTDVIYTDTDTGISHIHKTPTTTKDPSVGMVKGITEICSRYGIERNRIDHIFHGTTIATNAVLEHNGAKTGLITTKGYRDILQIGRHQRPENYSIAQEIPWQDNSMVERRYRRTVSERIGLSNGKAYEKIPLDEDEVIKILNEFKNEGIESVVVGFLFSYLEPEHEERVKKIISEKFPDFYVTASANISPQFREFERFATASMNGFVGPVMKGYIESLESRLREAEVDCDLLIMTSNGGVANSRTVSEKPVMTLLSGPAAGVLGGQWAGKLSDHQRLITFDVGGTSADIGIVTERGFSEAIAGDTQIAGYPVQVPMIDIHTIGAGGGSIAYVDAGGAFKVGPRSAGSYPGPACYGRGGELPTVTDATLVLGRLDPDHFLDGEMKIYPEKAVQAVQDLASTLGLGLYETAEGILTIVNNNMANAIRSRTIQKGFDPRGFSLAALGGGGPMCSVEVAKILDIPEVIIPPYPGITSATGLLTTDLKYDAVQTIFMSSDRLDTDYLNQKYKSLEEDIAGQLGEAGFAPDKITLLHFFDCRYVGQGYELRIPVASGSIDAANIHAIWETFHTVHKREYGHAFPDASIEIVNMRVTGIGNMPKIADPDFSEGVHSLIKAKVKTAPAWFRSDGSLKTFDTPHYQKETLPINEPIPGPCIILQKDTTSVIPPDCTATMLANGSILVEIGVEV